MPIVEFRCKNCGHRQERILKHTMDTSRCENCNEYAHKVLSAPVAHFKGPGFFVNDYPKTDAGDTY